MNRQSAPPLWSPSGNRPRREGRFAPPVRNRRRSRASGVAGAFATFALVIGYLVVCSLLPEASTWLTDLSGPRDARRKVTVPAREGWQSNRPPRPWTSEV